MSQYLETNCASGLTDVLKWRKEHENAYPILAKITRDKLVIMSTSVPVERLFSHEALIDQQKRVFESTFMP